MFSVIYLYFVVNEKGVFFLKYKIILKNLEVLEICYDLLFIIYVIGIL